VIAEVMTAITPAREALFARARVAGAEVRPEALDADALVATVTGGRSGGTASAEAPPHRCAPRSKILVRVDLDALLRGRPVDGEVCEIAGYGPVAVSAVREMLATGDAVLACIVTKGEQVCGVAHYGRKALAIQQTALEWAQPSCGSDGCTQTGRLEIDHREAWAHRRITLTDLLDRLCDHHHDLKTYQRWELVDIAGGRRRMLPPTDPRNPHHRRQRERTRGDPPAA
jgi:hypothetical protein